MNDDFERNPRRKFELKMRPIADDLYCRIMPEIVSIERFDKDAERHILDREFAIDVKFQLSEMSLTCQEKFRECSYVNYLDVTVEYYNNPALRIKGDWFNLAAQLYFVGYASKEYNSFEKWILLDWCRVVLETLRGNIKWQMGISQSRNGLASFNAAKMANFPACCVLASSGFPRGLTPLGVISTCPNAGVKE